MLLNKFLENLKQFQVPVLILLYLNVLTFINYLMYLLNQSDILFRNSSYLNHFVFSCAAVIIVHNHSSCQKVLRPGTERHRTRFTVPVAALRMKQIIFSSLWMAGGLKYHPETAGTMADLVRFTVFPE